MAEEQQQDRLDVFCQHTEDLKEGVTQSGDKSRPANVSDDVKQQHSEEDPNNSGEDMVPKFKAGEDCNRDKKPLEANPLEVLNDRMDEQVDGPTKRDSTAINDTNIKDGQGLLNTSALEDEKDTLQNAAPEETPIPLKTPEVEQSDEQGKNVETIGPTSAEATEAAVSGAANISAAGEDCNRDRKPLEANPLEVLNDRTNEQVDGPTKRDPTAINDTNIEDGEDLLNTSALEDEKDTLQNAAPEETPILLKTSEVEQSDEQGKNVETIGPTSAEATEAAVSGAANISAAGEDCNRDRKPLEASPLQDTMDEQVDDRMDEQVDGPTKRDSTAINDTNIEDGEGLLNTSALEDEKDTLQNAAPEETPIPLKTSEVEQSDEQGNNGETIGPTSAEATEAAVAGAANISAAGEDCNRDRKPLEANPPEVLNDRMDEQVDEPTKRDSTAINDTNIEDGEDLLNTSALEDKKDTLQNAAPEETPILLKTSEVEQSDEQGNNVETIGPTSAEATEAAVSGAANISAAGEDCNRDRKPLEANPPEVLNDRMDEQVDGPTKRDPTAINDTNIEDGEDLLNTSALEDEKDTLQNAAPEETPILLKTPEVEQSDEQGNNVETIGPTSAEATEAAVSGAANISAAGEDCNRDRKPLEANPPEVLNDRMDEQVDGPTKRDPTAINDTNIEDGEDLLNTSALEDKKDTLQNAAPEETPILLKTSEVEQSDEQGNNVETIGPTSAEATEAAVSGAANISAAGEDCNRDRKPLEANPPEVLNDRMDEQVDGPTKRDPTAINDTNIEDGEDLLNTSALEDEKDTLQNAAPEETPILLKTSEVEQSDEQGNNVETIGPTSAEATEAAVSGAANISAAGEDCNRDRKPLEANPPEVLNDRMDEQVDGPTKRDPTAINDTNIEDGEDLLNTSALEDEKDTLQNAAPEETPILLKTSEVEQSDEQGNNVETIGPTSAEATEAAVSGAANISAGKKIFWIVVCGVAILGILIQHHLKSESPPQKKDVRQIDIFLKQMEKVKTQFPNQRAVLWTRSRIHLKRHLQTAQPTEPVSLILTSGLKAERTLHCLAQSLASAFSSALNASVLHIDGASKASQDSDQVKLDIDSKLQGAFEGDKPVAVIHRFEELPPGSTLIFYRYCDHENAAYKKTFLIFTVLLGEEEEIPTKIHLSTVEEMVDDHLQKKFLSDDYPVSFDRMDLDKYVGLWSCISHLILPVAAEESVEQEGC
ncbi:uncharacterized protein LOC121652768 isoform X5 [Melanotaenia boesemani]|uniref:uncharacterized protein LOC121652768 isoform X5 n=1 Tax=Melanotaenia boesemani TaxID=1250792 RepID=UPI001C05D7A8|nr:uncharacterized protein LOC121652768 isoform X5 [Melanotaenia boesemani]